MDSFYSSYNFCLKKFLLFSMTLFFWYCKCNTDICTFGKLLANLKIPSQPIVPFPQWLGGKLECLSFVDCPGRQTSIKIWMKYQNNLTRLMVFQEPRLEEMWKFRDKNLKQGRDQAIWLRNDNRPIRFCGWEPICHLDLFSCPVKRNSTHLTLKYFASAIRNFALRRPIFPDFYNHFMAFSLRDFALGSLPFSR